jgi:hypothetical protein
MVRRVPLPCFEQLKAARSVARSTQCSSHIQQSATKATAESTSVHGIGAAQANTSPLVAGTGRFSMAAAVAFEDGCFATAARAASPDGGRGAIGGNTICKLESCSAVLMSAQWPVEQMQGAVVLPV